MAEYFLLTNAVASEFLSNVRRRREERARIEPALWHQVLAFGAETFVFVYMGLAVFGFEQDHAHDWLAAVAIGAMLVSRVFNIVPAAGLVNVGRRRERRISCDVQKLLMVSGLRGAIAFALALKARDQFRCRAGLCR
jgi:NhaP-type Na+/H+ or K+/H+ antiporter